MKKDLGGGGVDSADTDTDWGQEGGESQFNRNVPKCEQKTAASHQVYHSRAEDEILRQDPQMRTPLDRDRHKGMRDKSREDWKDSYHSPELPDN